MSPGWSEPTSERIEQALATEGGHLAIGRGGFCLYFDQGSMLSGYDCDAMKTQCIAYGLPVIGGRQVPFEIAMDLVVRGPMIAVGRLADPPPWNALSSAPLHIVADIYRRAGAEVFNLPSPVEAEAAD